MYKVVNINSNVYESPDTKVTEFPGYDAAFHFARTLSVTTNYVTGVVYAGKPVAMFFEGMVYFR